MRPIIIHGDFRGAGPRTSQETIELREARELTHSMLFFLSPSVIGAVVLCWGGLCHNVQPEACQSLGYIPR